MASSFRLPHLTDEQMYQIQNPSVNTRRHRLGSVPTRFHYVKPDVGDEDDEREDCLPPVGESSHNTQCAPSSSTYPRQGMADGAVHQTPSTHDAQKNYLQNLVVELRLSNSKQTDLITELKIKVAVLENDLSYARQDKDFARNSLGLVIDTFSRASSHSQHSLSTSITRLEDHASRGVIAKNIQALKDAEREIEELRKQVKRQARILKENKGSHWDRSQSPVGPHDGYRAPASPAGNLHGRSMLSETGKKVSFRMNKWKQSPIDTNPNDPPLFIESPTLKTEELSQSSLPTCVLQQDSSFATTTTTYPNTPTSPTQPETPIQDEFTPIDELFYSSSDEDARKQKKQREKYFNPPTPGILKTGITSTGTYIGNDSEFTPSGNVPWNKWGGVSRPEGLLPNPFAPPTLQNFTSNLLTDSPEIPFQRSSDSAVWKSPGERQIAIQIHQNACTIEHRLPDFFKYGAQFIPSESDTDYDRSVLISNLPHDIQLRDVLALVRGGEIFSSTLCNTIPLTGSMTILLVFKFSSGAKNFIQNCTARPLIFFSDPEPLPRTALISGIPTPTYPTNQTRLNEHSRCLRIPDFPRHFPISELQTDIACNNAYRALSLLEVWISEDRSLNLQFASVDAAGSTLGLLVGKLRGRAKYRDLCLKVQFWYDPCSEPVDDEVGSLDRRWSKPSYVLKGKGRDMDDGDVDGYSTGRKVQDLQRVANQTRQQSELQAPGVERKRLLALTNQKIDIPTLNGSSIDGTSWADEVNDEQNQTQNREQEQEHEQKDEQEQVSVFISDPTIPSPLPTTDYTKNIRTPLKSPSLIKSTQEKSLSLDYDDVDINRLMADKSHQMWKERKRPVGLAGSKYADSLPGFEERGRKLRRSTSGDQVELRDHGDGYYMGRGASAVCVSSTHSHSTDLFSQTEAEMEAELALALRMANRNQEERARGREGTEIEVVVESSSGEVHHDERLQVQRSGVEEEKNSDEIDIEISDDEDDCTSDPLAKPKAESSTDTKANENQVEEEEEELEEGEIRECLDSA